MVPAELGLLLSLLDGEHTITDIQTAIVQRTHEFVTSDQVREIIEQLDGFHVLEGESFERYQAERLEAFRQGSVRVPTHAGQAYEADPDRLREQLRGLFEHEQGPGLPQASAGTRRLCGVLSPHIDLQRGGPTFAWAYKELAEKCDADLFVVLGTVHAPTRRRFVLTRLDFQTPLGVVQTDRPFVDRLSDLAGSQYFDDELTHAAEHSIEFQILFLQYVLSERHRFQIVPILVGSFQDLLADDGDPADHPELQRFVEALHQAATESGKRVAYVSGADLSHVGRQFGDDERLSDSFLEQVRQEDLAMLAPAEQLDAHGFFDCVRREGDRRRICGLPPTYVMLSALRARGDGACRGKLLRYDQAVDDRRFGCVSFASMAFYEPEA